MFRRSAEEDGWKERQAKLREQDAKRFRRSLAAVLRERLGPYSIAITITADEARSIIEELEK
jgi:hypothetical protein